MHQNISVWEYLWIKKYHRQPHNSGLTVCDKRRLLLLHLCLSTQDWRRCCKLLRTAPKVVVAFSYFTTMSQNRKQNSCISKHVQVYDLAYINIITLWNRLEKFPNLILINCFILFYCCSSSMGINSIHSFKGLLLVKQ